MEQFDYQYMCEFATAYSRLDKQDHKIIEFLLRQEFENGQSVFIGTMQSAGRAMGEPHPNNLFYAFKKLEKWGVLYLQDDKKEKKEKGEKLVPYQKKIYLTFNWTDILVKKLYDGEL